MATRRPNGRWRAQVFIGLDEKGKRRYKSFDADTADEADLAALSWKLGKGKKVEKKSVTLRLAMNAYIQSKDGVLAMSTVVNYRRMMNNFGEYLDTPLDAINTINLQKAITEFARRDKLGMHSGTGKVSPKTVRNMYGLISATLKQNGIYINGVTLPQRRAVEYHTPFDNDLAAIFRATEGTSIEIPVLLAAWCSLRRSEILGLKYTDIDVENNVIHVRQAKVYVGANVEIKEPKTASSKRSVFLPDYIAEKIIEQQRTVGGEYVVPLAGNTITKNFGTIIKNNNLPHCRFHDLRHAFVSILAAQGVDAKYIQEMGGWSSSGVMNSVYKQTSLNLKREISKKVENIFLGILQPDAT